MDDRQFAKPSRHFPATLGMLTQAVGCYLESAR